MRVLFVALLCSFLAQAQKPVTIRVNAAQRHGSFNPVWRYFGYDEPNYTYADHGRELIHELAALSYQPVHIRTHFLLVTGEGAPALKWGSTNVYTEDSSGKPIYDWTIVDKIVGTYVNTGVTPFVEIGFMPRALSSHPDPYQPVWKPHGNSADYNLGWTYPPKDFRKWGELVYQWVKHCVTKYGRNEVTGWDWEVWNEPDIGYWHGTPQEYDALYDYTSDAVKRALPGARIGGPASTGPAGARAADFLKQFLSHCLSGVNAATGKRGAPLDFVSFHAKGRPEIVAGNVRMGLSQELKDVSEGFAIVRSFSKFQNLPIVISEADPEGCAACSARIYPQNIYRNGPLYASYEAAALKAILALAATSKANLQGILTWAFEFENQPYFDGFRTLATNGIDKPVLNLFRMAGLLRGDLAEVESNGAVPATAIVQSGVREKTDVDALAVASDHGVRVLIWNYQDDDVNGMPTDVDLKIAGMPLKRQRVLLQHYRIDESHSNSYALWKQMGSPLSPSTKQYEELKSAGQLQLLNSPEWLDSREGSTETKFVLPLQGVSLVEFSWSF